MFNHRSQQHNNNNYSSLSSSININYMDGVPVKLSEKLKPPPLIQLSQSVVDKFSSVGQKFDEYDFTLEKNVLENILQWKSVRKKANDERDARLLKWQQDKQREFEQKQKQLLTAVSYPSTDDLYSNSSDDEEHQQELDNINQCTTTTTVTTNNNNNISLKQEQQHLSPPNYFDNILLPTILHKTEQTSDNTNLLENIINIPNKPKEQQENQLKKSTDFNKINYSDFESDTASPFDKYELKTINDLDILAQVLKNTATIQENDDNKTVSTDNDEFENEKPIDNSSNKQESDVSTDTSIDDKFNAAIKNIQYDYPIDDHQPQMDSHQLVQSIEQHLTHNENNSFQNSDQQLHNNPYQQQQPEILPQLNHNNQFINNNINFPIHLQQYSNYNFINNHQVINNNNNNNNNHHRIPDDSSSQNTSILQSSIYNNNATVNNFIKNGYFPEYDKYFYCNNDNNSNNNININNNNIPDQKQNYAACDYNFPDYYSNNPDDSTTTVGQSKSKSKSVPDILKQLNDDLYNSAQKRARNNSQSILTPSSEENDVSEIFVEYEKSKGKQKDDELFKQLSKSSQQLVLYISSMGFPLDQVSRAASKFGNDDKKIVEHLIPLGELLDLGFDETIVSDALIKFDNDKEKALDSLIT